MVKTSKLSVSQSFLKKYWDYQNGLECGYALYMIDIMKQLERKPTDPMLTGSWFEYLCTGSINRNGTIPEPVKTTKGMLTAESKRAELQVANFKRLIEREKFDIQRVDETLEYYFPNQNFKIKGVLDILGFKDDSEAILDIKSSGLIGN